MLADLQIWYDTLKERHRVQVFENLMQREALGLKRHGQAGNNNVPKHSLSFVCCDRVEGCLFEGEWECICSLR
jgi:hypothetical protein